MKHCSFVLESEFWSESEFVKRMFNLLRRNLSDNEELDDNNDEDIEE